MSNTNTSDTNSSLSQSCFNDSYYDDVTDDDDVYPADWQIVLAINYIIMAIVSPTLNLLIIVIICRSRELRTPTNTFISSLAFGETLFSLFSLPFTAASLLQNSWPFSASTCQGSAFMQTLGRTFSSYCLLLVCFDRYIAISRPLKYTNIITLTFSFVSVAIVWCFALILCIVLLFAWDSYSYHENLFLCTAEMSNRQSQGARVKEVVSSYIPIFLTLMYLLVVVKEVKSHHRIFAMVPLPDPAAVAAARYSSNNTTTNPTTSGRRNNDNVIGILPVSRTMGGFNRNTRRALRSFFIMALSLVVCCLPISLTFLVVSADHLTLASSSNPLLIVPMFFSIVYSIVNPIVVIIFNRKFRSQLKQMVMLMCYCGRIPDKATQQPDVFTISSGLQSVLDTTLIKTLGRGGKTSITQSLRRTRISVTT